MKALSKTVVALIAMVIVFVFLVALFYQKVDEFARYFTKLLSGYKNPSIDDLLETGTCTPQTKGEQAIVCAYYLVLHPDDIGYYCNGVEYQGTSAFISVQPGEEIVIDTSRIQAGKKDQIPVVLADDETLTSDYSGDHSGSDICNTVVCYQDTSPIWLCDQGFFFLLPTRYEKEKTKKDLYVSTICGDYPVKNVITSTKIKVPDTCENGGKPIKMSVVCESLSIRPATKYCTVNFLCEYLHE